MRAWVGKHGQSCFIYDAYNNYCFISTSVHKWWLWVKCNNVYMETKTQTLMNVGGGGGAGPVGGGGMLPQRGHVNPRGERQRRRPRIKTEDVRLDPQRHMGMIAEFTADEVRNMLRQNRDHNQIRIIADAIRYGAEPIDVVERWLQEYSDTVRRQQMNVLATRSHMSAYRLWSNALIERKNRMRELAAQQAGIEAIVHRESDGEEQDAENERMRNTIRAELAAFNRRTRQREPWEPSYAMGFGKAMIDMAGVVAELVNEKGRKRVRSAEAEENEAETPETEELQRMLTEAGYKAAIDEFVSFFGAYGGNPM